MKMKGLEHGGGQRNMVRKYDVQKKGKLVQGRQ